MNLQNMARHLWVILLKIYSKLYLLVILTIATSTNLYAQIESEIRSPILDNEAPSLRFEHLNLESGMIQGSANNMIQDSKGYMWVATQGGLHRYNGYEFEVFTSIPFDTTSLSETWVWGVNESRSGDLWVATSGGGVNKLDPNTGKAVHYRHDPDDSTTISNDFVFYPFESSNGDLWVSTFGSGLNWMKADEDGIFTRLFHDPDNSKSLTTNEIYWVGEDPDGDVWAGSSNGINRINPETGDITRYMYNSDLRNSFYGAMENVFQAYFPSDNQGVAWLSTGGGLVRLDIESGEYTRFLIEEGNPVMSFIHSLRPDPTDPNIIWVGGPGAGIARFDTQREEFTSYRHNPKDQTSLSTNDVVSLALDRSGMIWAGTTVEGMNVFNPSAVNFTHIKHSEDDPNTLADGSVWGILEDSHGSLWVGTITGTGVERQTLTKFDASTKRVIKYKHDENRFNTIPPGDLRAFTEDAEGNVWIGASGGLSKIDKTGRITGYPHDREQFTRRDGIFRVMPIPTDSSQLWIGSLDGLEKFDSKSEQFQPIKMLPDSFGIPDPVVLSLDYSDGILWIGTGNGLYKMDSDESVELVSRYDGKDTTQISDNGLRTLLVGRKDPSIVWLGTTHGGLNRLEIETGKIKHYFVEDGLPDNTIYGILEDDAGTLWMSTNGGISNFDPETETFRNYSLDDGLMDLEYNQNAYAKGRGGMLYFGSGDGVTAFNPQNLRVNTIPPQVDISDFKLFNKPIVPGPESLIKKSLAETEEITLEYDQNEVTFEYVGLHFANPKMNRYRYQLVGYDDDWVDAGSQRVATYTNLKPGEYTFRVIAANADGVWNEEGASLQVTVLPPWYQTWWAYSLFILIFAAGVFAVDRIQRYRLAKKQQERVALREAELRAEAENKRRADTEELSKIGRAITSSLSVDKIIETVYENVNALMDASIFGVGIYNKERNRLDFPATKEEGEMLRPYANNLNEDHWLSVWCFKNKKEIVISDFEKEYSQYLSSYSAPIEGKNPRSILYMPLIQQDRIIGVITTQSFEENTYSEYHVNLLRNLANYAAIALDNASAYRKLDATLSELKSTQEQLVQQEKMASLGELTAGIAHEIQNPLNFVNNFSDVNSELVHELLEEIEKGNLQEVKDLANDIEENEKKIIHHGRRAEDIVKSMLQHSRGSSGEKQLTDINDLADEYLRLAFHGIRAKDKSFNANLETSFDENIGEIKVVPQDIGRVILNLINNAFQATHNKQNFESNGYNPEVSIATRKHGNEVEISIKDNGPGIPDEIKEKIFEPFFTTKDTGEGTGLGLSISYDIITKGHGGQLKVKSEPGEGTEFLIVLPV